MALVCNCTLPPSACRTCVNFQNYYGADAVGSRMLKWRVQDGTTWVPESEIEVLRAEIERLRAEVAELRLARRVYADR
jgi:hypothetical protein